MKTFQFMVIPLLILCSTALFADPANVLINNENFQNIGYRFEGSREESLAFDRIAEEITRIGFPYFREEIDTIERGHSYSEILKVIIPGELDETFVLASPIDKGAFSSSILIEIAEYLIINPPQHTIILLFLGAERGEGEFYPFGSRHAIEDITWYDGSFVIYLEAEDIPQSWQIVLGGNRKITPIWLTQNLIDTFIAESIPHRLQGTDIHVAHIGIQNELGPSEIWHDAGIATILLQGSGVSDTANTNQQINKLVQALLNIDYQIEAKPKANEVVYTFFRPFQGMKPRFFREIPFVIAILILITLIASVILLRIRQVGLNFRRYAPKWWTFPLLFFVVFLFSFLATLFIEETLYFADFPELWTHAVGIFIFFKFALAIVLTLIFIWLTDALPLPRSPHFYSYLSVITSVFMTLGCMALDITLSVYALWTTITLIVFTAIRNFRWKILLLLLAILPYGMALAVVIRRPYLDILEFLLLSRIRGNLVITSIFMPPIFAMTSLNYWWTHYKRVRTNILTPTATLVLSLIATVTLIWILNLKPFSGKITQPVILIDHIDLIQNSRRLEIESPGPIGDMRLELEGSSYSLEDLGRRAEVRTPLVDVPLDIRVNSRTFLGRRNIVVLITGEGQPQRINMNLESTEPFTLHEASQPFEMAPTGQNAEIFIGETPPFPLELRFTVNSEAQITLSYTAIWDDPEYAPQIDRRDLQVSSRRIVQNRTQL